MELFNRFFGKKRLDDARVTADRVRQQHAPGRIEIVTAAEAQATRGRMEADMDAQRDRRAHDQEPHA